MEHFPFMENCLKEWNYPQIRSMSDENIHEIFSKKNRRFLTGWILKQIDEGFGAVLEKDEKELGSLIHLFCLPSEAEKFLDGECDLDKQMSILYKMFDNLHNIKLYKNAEPAQETSIADLEAFLKLDTNLFPQYGSKKTLTPAERKKKIEEFSGEAQKLQEEISKAAGAENKKNVDPELKNRLLAVMENFNENFSNVKKKILKLPLDRTLADARSQECVEDLVQRLEDWNEKMKLMLKVVKSLNVMLNLETIDKDLPKIKTSHLIDKIAQLCEEISNLENDI